MFFSNIVHVGQNSCTILFSNFSFGKLSLVQKSALNLLLWYLMKTPDKSLNFFLQNLRSYGFLVTVGALSSLFHLLIFNRLGYLDDHDRTILLWHIVMHFCVDFYDICFESLSLQKIQPWPIARPLVFAVGINSMIE